MCKNRVVSFLFGFGIVVLLTTVIKIFAPSGQETYGVISLIPAFFLIVYIFKTRRILEALILSSIMCFIISDGTSFLTEFNIGLTSVMMEENTGWLIIVCGLMGSLIALIEKAGGSFAFGKWVSTKAKTRKGVLIWTWILGVVIFIDDYLNSLTVGSCMSPITDKHKVSREELSYIVDSTAAPVCVLIPISTWAVFAGRLLSEQGLCDESEIIQYFCKTIPFNFYAWAAVIIVLLLILGVFPKIGLMRKADKRIAEGGSLAPEGSEKIDIRSTKKIEIPENPKIMNFILPTICLVVSTIVFDVDMQKGVIVTIVFTFFLYVLQGIMTPAEFADTCIEGLKNMILPLMLMILAFLFGYASSRINFTRQVIDYIVPVMQRTPQLMPVLIFIVLGATEFITGTNWGLYIIALPIVVPLSQAINANTLLCVSSVLSAGVFGSHICFYSDATVLSSSACGCNNFDHAASQMPYGLISAGVAAIGFLIAGFVV